MVVTRRRAEIITVRRHTVAVVVRRIAVAVAAVRLRRRTIALQHHHTLVLAVAHPIRVEVRTVATRVVDSFN